MVRLVCWFLSLCLAIGAGDAFVRLTLDLAKAAARAHQHQLSYSQFTHALLSAKPRTVVPPPEKRPER